MAAKGYAKLYLKEPVSLWSLLPYLQMMPKVASRFALRPSPPSNPPGSRCDSQLGLRGRTQGSSLAVFRCYPSLSLLTGLRARRLQPKATCVVWESKPAGAGSHRYSYGWIRVEYRCDDGIARRYCVGIADLQKNCGGKRKDAQEEV